jgi:hypothetical protein
MTNTIKCALLRADCVIPARSDTELAACNAVDCGPGWSLVPSDMAAAESHIATAIELVGAIRALLASPTPVRGYVAPSGGAAIQRRASSLRCGARVYVRCGRGSIATGRYVRCPRVVTAARADRGRHGREPSTLRDRASSTPGASRDRNRSHDRPAWIDPAVGGNWSGRQHSPGPEG